MANILYTNFHKYEGGGHTTYVLSLLQNTEHRLFVACPSTSLLYRILEERGHPGLRALDFPCKPREWRSILENVGKLRRIVLDEKIDVVHTAGSNDNRMAHYVSWLTGGRFRIVLTKHNTIRPKNTVSRFRLNRMNDAVIFVGDILDYLNLDRSNPRFYVIPNGIDLDYWKREAPVETGRRLTLVSTAGAGRHKGWHHMIEAIKTLGCEERTRLRVVMLARYEQDMADELAEAGQVCDFSLAGYHTDVRPLLEEADIGFVLSYKEACSFACREMMAMSLPVVVSDFPVLVNNINNQSGWVTKVKDADSIREVLRRILLMSPEAVSQMKKAARAKAEADFPLERMIADTNRVYAEILKR